MSCLSFLDVYNYMLYVSVCLDVWADSVSSPLPHLILRSAAMQDAGMPHCDVCSDDTRAARIQVDHGEILDVAAIAHLDVGIIAPQNAVEPHAHLLAQADVSNDPGTWGDPGAAGNHGHTLAKGIDQRRHVDGCGWLKMAVV